MAPGAAMVFGFLYASGDGADAGGLGGDDGACAAAAVGLGVAAGRDDAGGVDARPLGADGGLSNRRLFWQFDDVFPDGICLDAEGGIWVADPRGHRAIRAIEGKGIVQTIPMKPGRHAFACMLGGEDRRTLYICTSTASGPAMADKRDGAIEAIRVEVAGVGLP